MIKRMLSLVFVFTIVICLSLSAFALTTEESYNEALAQLKPLLSTYSTTQDEQVEQTVETLDDLWLKFFELGKYRYSQQFVDYIDVLRSIENNDYDRIILLISILNNSGSFVEFLADENVSMLDGNMTLGTIDELEAYANARKAQYENDEKSEEIAYENYIKCNNFLDSYERMRSLYSGQYEVDYQKAIQLIKNDNLDDYIKERDLLNELVKTGYRNSEGYLENVNRRIDMLSAPTPTPTPTRKPTAKPTRKPTPTPEQESANNPTPTPTPEQKPAHNPIPDSEQKPGHSIMPDSEQEAEDTPTFEWPDFIEIPEFNLLPERP